MTDTFATDNVVFSLACAPGTLPDQPGLWLAGATWGLYRSEDGGNSWLNLYDRLDMRTLLPVTCAAFSPQYAEDHTLFATVAGNVFRSEDGGETWQGVYIATPLPNITSLVISPNFLHDSTLFVGTLEDGIFQSTDRGRNWKPTNFGLLDLHVLSLAIAPNYAGAPYLLAGTESGLFRSKNGGRAWRDVSLPGGYEPVLSLGFSPSFAEDGLAYAGTETKGIFVTHNRGNHWQPLDAPLTESVSAIYPLPGNRLAALLETGLYALRDGDQWQPWNAAVNFEDISAAVILGDPPMALAAGLGGRFQWMGETE